MPITITPVTHRLPSSVSESSGAKKGSRRLRSRSGSVRRLLCSRYETFCHPQTTRFSYPLCHLQPMEPLPASKLPDGLEWVWKNKLDGCHRAGPGNRPHERRQSGVVVNGCVRLGVAGSSVKVPAHLSTRLSIWR